MKLNELVDLLEGDFDKAIKIIEVASDVSRYLFHADAVSIGISFRPEDLTFKDLLLFKWIKEILNG